ncbi:MAG: tRNA (adenosine(37)-N6)-threonylcarbamoyltransferase complex dimerization subunit type 1 TsaB [Halofilum sp. (in: g-proteobacteria)]
MNLLAFDTATEACSAALATPEGIHTRAVEAPREHGDRLLAMIDELLDEAALTAAELDLLAYGRGPGAFTGVRIAVGAVQGIAFAQQLPVIGVSTLAALAQGALRRHGQERVAAAIDARMGEVYWGAFVADGAGLMQPVVAEAVAAPGGVEAPPGTGWCGIGTGWETHGAALSERLGAALAVDLGRALPDAGDMLPLAQAAHARGEAVSAAEALPVYLRDRVAEKPRPR